MLIRTDTIAALATPEGEGGIAIVRVSGAQAADVAARVAEVEETAAAASDTVASYEDLGSEEF